MENKQLICDLLLPCLQKTRNLDNLNSLEYVREGYNETVKATFNNGYVKLANVSSDSGTAMIQDILRAIV